MDKVPWKIKLLWGGVGLLWGAVLVFAAGIWFLRTDLIEERECPLPWERAVAEFPQFVTRIPGWTVRTVPCGLPAPVKGERIAVFEICSRKYAGERQPVYPAQCYDIFIVFSVQCFISGGG